MRSLGLFMIKQSGKCSHVSTHSANVESPNIDLFASRLNYQLKPDVSWMPDQEACHVDAFTLD